MDHDKDCPFHGDACAPDDEFGEMVSALVTLYLLGKGEIPCDEQGRALVVVHAEHDDAADIFMLKIGIGLDAHTIMTAERDAAQAARQGGAE